MLERKSGYIPLGNNKLHYLQTGTGSRVALAIHGYGDNAVLFNPICNYLHNDFTIISLDLPHHGKSDWPDEGQLTIDDLKGIVTFLLQKFNVRSFTLMGYSMGGRVCMKIVELLPEHIDKVVLVASDGLVFNPFYYFMTRTFAGKKLFRSFLTEPQRYMPVINFGKSIGLVTRERYAFAMKYIHATADRAFLYKVWPSLCLLIPDSKKLIKAIQHHDIPVHIFMGAKDPVIPASHAKRFKSKYDKVQVYILDKGHRILDADTLPMMANSILA